MAFSPTVKKLYIRYLTEWIRNNENQFGRVLYIYVSFYEPHPIKLIQTRKCNIKTPPNWFSLIIFLSFCWIFLYNCLSFHQLDILSIYLFI